MADTCNLSEREEDFRKQSAWVSVQPVGMAQVCTLWRSLWCTCAVHMHDKERQPPLCAVSGFTDAAVDSLCPSCRLFSSACEVWGAALHWSSRTQHAPLITAHLGRLRRLAGLRKAPPENIIYAQLAELRLELVWLLRAARLWNDLLAGPEYQPVCSKMLLLFPGLGAETG